MPEWSIWCGTGSRRTQWHRGPGRQPLQTCALHVRGPGCLPQLGRWCHRFRVLLESRRCFFFLLLLDLLDSSDPLLDLDLFVCLFVCLSLVAVSDLFDVCNAGALTLSALCLSDKLAFSSSFASSLSSSNCTSSFSDSGGSSRFIGEANPLAAAHRNINSW